MADRLTAGMGAVWVQPDGPNTEVLYLGCHDVADIVQPRGDVALRYCPSIEGPESWNTATESQGPPSPVTTTLTTYVAVTRDYLQDVSCPASVYVHQSMCGRRDVFNNYDQGSLLYNSRITSKTKTNLAMREGADASEQAFDLSAQPPLSEYQKLQVTRQTTAETEDLLDIASMGQDQCWGYCGDKSSRCDEMVITEGVTGGVQDILITTDSGTTWTAVAGPFIAAMGISSVVAFQMDRDTTRILVANGTTQVALPAEVSYSDDSGANWTDVTVGTLNAEFFQWNGTLFAGNQYNIWGGTDAGGIWFSADGGATWTEQITTNTVDINCIDFANEDVGIIVGDTNLVMSTEDGGAHWTTEVGPVAQNAAHALSCVCHDRMRWLVGYNDGELWYTHDGGANWSQRTLPTPATAVSVDTVNAMDWLNHYHGILVVGWTGAGAADRGSIMVTHNGGYSWEDYSLPDTLTVDGSPAPQSGIICTERLAYSVGDIETTGTIYSLAP